MIMLLYENIIKAELTVVNKTGPRCCFSKRVGVTMKTGLSLSEAVDSCPDDAGTKRRVP